MNDGATITQDNAQSILDALYEKCLNGIPNVSRSVQEIADDYLSKNPYVKFAADELIKAQIAKCTTSGFLAGIGGAITLPVAISANIASVLYVQMRMIACLAYMGGYDLNSDQVQTLVYVCLADISINNIVKNSGIKIGEKAANVALKKLPGAVCIKINQRARFRLVTKFGSKGAINLCELIPVVGGVISGGFDFAETKRIANRAYKLFIEKDMKAVCDEGEEESLEQENAGDELQT